MIYLDSAATSMLKPPGVVAATARAITTMASPGRGGHKPAMDAARVAFQCREMAVKLFDLTDPEQVVFTFNATHGLNIAIKDLVKPGDTVVVSAWEHNAVTRPLSAIGQVNIRVAQAPLFDQAATLEAFSQAITPDTAAVVCTHVSNVFGYILPIQAIARLCRKRRVPLIVDASQSAGCLAVNMKDLDAAYIAMPGHKGLMGPQGTGLLLCQRIPVPLLEGGTGSNSLSQEMPDYLPDRLEAGTHNIPGLAGLLEGMRYVETKGHGRIHAHESALMQRMGEGLSKLSGIEIFRAGDPTVQAGVLSFRMKNRDCEDLGRQLGERGIALRAGLHCAPTAHRSAGTLETGTVRASVSPFNSAGEIAAFLQTLSRIIRESDGSSRAGRP